MHELRKQQSVTPSLAGELKMPGSQSYTRNNHGQRKNDSIRTRIASSSSGWKYGARELAGSCWKLSSWLRERTEIPLRSRSTHLRMNVSAHSFYCVSEKRGMGDFFLLFTAIFFFIFPSSFISESHLTCPSCYARLAYQTKDE